MGKPQAQYSVCIKKYQLKDHVHTQLWYEGCVHKSNTVHKKIKLNNLRRVYTIVSISLCAKSINWKSTCTITICRPKSRVHVKIKVNNGRRACMKIPSQPQTQRALRPHHWPGTGKIWRTSLAWCSIPLVIVPLVVVPLVVVSLVIVPLVIVPLVVVPLVDVPLSFLFKNITLLCYHYHFYDISFVNRNGAQVNSYVLFWGLSSSL